MRIHILERNGHAQRPWINDNSLLASSRQAGSVCVLTSCPKMRVHISAPVSSASAMTATPSVATACTEDSSLLASFSFSFSLLLLSFDDLPKKCEGHVRK